MSPRGALTDTLSLLSEGRPNGQSSYGICEENKGGLVKVGTIHFLHGEKRYFGVNDEVVWTVPSADTHLSCEKLYYSHVKFGVKIKSKDFCCKVSTLMSVPLLCM